MDRNEITKEIQEWIFAEERAGRKVDIDRINAHLQVMMHRENSKPREYFNGLSSEDIHRMIYHPFEGHCIVKLNKLNSEQYNEIPLVRQTMFLLNTLGEKELKLTKLGWLPLKVVDEAYHIGQPEYWIEEFRQKRINEYEATSVWMAHYILESLGWIKKRKGNLSLTVKGKKALSDMTSAGNDIIYAALTKVGLNSFDGYENIEIGNIGLPYSVWLLDKFGNEWHTGDFYYNHYRKVFNYPGVGHAYEVRVFERLFYWLGITEEQRTETIPREWEFKKTDLLSIIFTIEKPV